MNLYDDQLEVLQNISLKNALKLKERLRQEKYETSREKQFKVKFNIPWTSRLFF